MSNDNDGQIYTNPQIAVATSDGARNTIPSFITRNGPVREAVRVRSEHFGQRQPCVRRRRARSAGASPSAGDRSDIVPVPIRIIISADGSVKHVHVIRATVDQRNAIEAALGQWKFKSPGMRDRVAEIETRLMIEFTPEGTVKYLPSDRAGQY
jgi:hypothetical protein